MSFDREGKKQYKTRKQPKESGSIKLKEMGNFRCRSIFHPPERWTPCKI